MRLPDATELLGQTLVRYEQEVAKHNFTISIFRDVCEGRVDPKRVRFDAGGWRLLPALAPAADAEPKAD